MNTDRRRFVQAALALALSGCSTMPGSSTGRARVVVVGGGFGGASAARYLRLLSQGTLDVTLIEPDATFVSCPLSNLVVGGNATLADLTLPYTTLSRHGVTIVRDTVASLDAAKRVVVLASGSRIAYDRLVLSPGVELLGSQVEGLVEAHDSGRILQAWKAGPETVALRSQLEAMPDGGVFAITIPEAPYRCPPGPYERACQVASYFKRAKPRSKVLVLDENADIVSKAALFRKSWMDLYPGMIEYRPRHKVVAVSAREGLLRFEVQEDVKADVLNVLPPMRAGRIAFDSGLADSNGRWCSVDYRSFESTIARRVHVIGDAVQSAPLMPKSGHMANAHAKVAAAAVVAELSGWEIDPAPMLTNVCYSFVDATQAIHVSSVHAYAADEKTYKAVAGAGGVSVAANILEGRYAWNWARTIWADLIA